LSNQFFQLKASIEGRVQGVGFRMFVLERARNLQLTGWVRNTYDGQVEVLAEGPRPQLEALLDDLYRGPRGSWVESIQQDWQPATDMFTTFEVARTE
jgi:acylphosphatase